MQALVKAALLVALHEELRCFKRMAAAVLSFLLGFGVAFRCVAVEGIQFINAARVWGCGASFFLC